MTAAADLIDRLIREGSELDAALDDLDRAKRLVVRSEYPPAKIAPAVSDIHNAEVKLDALRRKDA